MSEEQVDAFVRVRTVEPILDEWWVRYTKAWCKADSLTPEDCR